jgi:hypothetical protein
MTDPLSQSKIGFAAAKPPRPRLEILIKSRRLSVLGMANPFYSLIVYRLL